MPHPRLLLLGLAQLALAVVLVVAGPRAGGEARVRIDNFSFGPGALSVAPGTTVVWHNGDDIPHTIGAADASFHSAALDSDETYAFTFPAAGEYVYFCGLHPFMTGKIIVTP
jgi:plastocyanin